MNRMYKHTRQQTCLILPLLLALTACGKPLPADKSNYAGRWQQSRMDLVINTDGTVNYLRRHDKGTTSVNAPIIRFEGNNFIVGIGPLHTTFMVEQPPHLEQGQWKMRVDGVELVRLPPANAKL
ncbi:MAG: hypothetical protein ACRERR_09530 [Moraxellaceae bacterium]